MIEHRLPRIKNLRQISSVLIVLLVAGIGTYVLTVSRAATPYASVNAGSGTPANGSAVKTCSGSAAANHQCMEFAINGASEAVCSPSCSAGTTTTRTLTNVSNDDGSTIPSRDYQVYRPAGLAASPPNLVPAIVMFYDSGTCGPFSFGRMNNVANSNRFVVITAEVPCGRSGTNWNKKWVNSASVSTPNDEPYVTAIVNDVTQCPSSGAAPYQCVDPKRIYSAGESSGGNMAADVSCDPTNSPLFRGHLVDSSSVQLYNGAPICPSTNKNFFMMMVLSNFSIDKGIYYDTLANPHLDVPAFADWAAQRLGCNGTRVDDTLLSTNLRYSYLGPCAYAINGSRAVETLGVINGGHTWSCQDSDPGSAADVSTSCPGLLTTANPPGPGLTNGATGRPQTSGLYVEQEFWNFVAQGISPP